MEISNPKERMKKAYFAIPWPTIYNALHQSVLQREAILRCQQGQSVEACQQH